jgi:hypothetical protein
MYKFSQQEWAALCAADDRNFVLSVRDDIIEASPHLANAPHLLKSLNIAFDEARRFGISDSRIVPFLWTQAHYPNLCGRQVVKDWMARQGTSPDQRFDMLLAVVRSKVKGFNSMLEKH